jgi:putative protein kinase ArgK-like GTPase of G3E family
MEHTVLAQHVALLEREQEVEHVQAALRAAGNRAGSAVLIEGAAGMGKSRLLDYAAARASELGFRVSGRRRVTRAMRGTTVCTGWPRT